MKLLFDLSATQSSAKIKNHGGAEYSIRVYKKLLESKGKLVDIESIYDNSRELPKEIETLNLEHNVKLVNFDSFEELEVIIEKGHYDVFFSGLGDHYRELKVPKKCKLIITVHGLRYLETFDDEYKKYYSKNMFKYQIREFRDKISKKNEKKYKESFIKHKKLLTNLNNNGKIIVDSKHSLNSVLAYFDDIERENIKVFYPPEKLSTKFSDRIEKKNYFLLISANRWIKNPIRGIFALDEFFNRDENKDFKAIILGSAPDSVKSKLKNLENFDFRDYVSTEELEKLYAEAYALFYPSLNEGFGYPPLEAMKYGTPILAAAITSIPEVCGDAALYFNPYSIKEMVGRLLEIKDADYGILRNKALQRYNLVKEKQEKDLEDLIEFLCKRN